MVLRVISRATEGRRRQIRIISVVRGVIEGRRQIRVMRLVREAFEGRRRQVEGTRVFRLIWASRWSGEGEVGF